MFLLEYLCSISNKERKNKSLYEHNDIIQTRLKRFFLGQSRNEYSICQYGNQLWNHRSFVLGYFPLEVMILNLAGQFKQKTSHNQQWKWAVMYLCVRSISLVMYLCVRSIYFAPVLWILEWILELSWQHKGNNKITELRTIFQKESQNSYVYKQTKSANNRKTGKP